MPNPLAHHPDMLIVKPDSLPRFWWLFPWSVCRQLHKNAVALRELCDRQETVMRVLRADFTNRRRWQIEHNESEHGVRYYFYDTYPCKSSSGDNYAHFRGKAYLYDGPSKSFAFETDPAKAIVRVNELNAR